MSDLLLVNGSPRGRRSNTRLLLGAVAEGFAKAQGGAVKTHLLSVRAAWPKIISEISNSTLVLIGMPLYAHAMPGIVKELIEQLPVWSVANARLGFVVQSGMPEPRQSFWLRAYLERLPARLGAENIGTVIRGATEGIQAMPSFAQRLVLRPLRLVGQDLARYGRFDRERLARLATPASMSSLKQRLFELNDKYGMGSRRYFGEMLAQHGALDRKYDRPYDSETPTCARADS
jgi:NAD(P)H-dependent FMN reductase